MGQNVGIFVDVSNLFYSAKSAEVEVNYCKLLSYATGGRHLIRACAYTGIDPENNSQRKFIDFLSANGYKVVCKDIHKYDTGRIKANLDIEIAVDMMLMAQNLDVAVLVSGDGDFARLVSAVQDKGVRFELVGFSNSTSNDLIQMVDAFTEISTIPDIFRNGGCAEPRVREESRERTFAGQPASHYYVQSATYPANGERYAGAYNQLTAHYPAYTQPVGQPQYYQTLPTTPPSSSLPAPNPAPKPNGTGA